MIETIEQFQTNDKKIFPTYEQAEQHVKDSCCIVLENSLMDYNGPGRITRSQEFEVIEHLVGDIAKARELVRALEKIVY